MTVPYAGKEKRGRSSISAASKSARVDLRCTPSTRATLDAMASRLRRTVASLMDEALEDIITKHASK